MGNLLLHCHFLLVLQHQAFQLKLGPFEGTFGCQQAQTRRKSQSMSVKPDPIGKIQQRCDRLADPGPANLQVIASQATNNVDQQETASCIIRPLSRDKATTGNQAFCSTVLSHTHTKAAKTNRVNQQSTSKR